MSHSFFLLILILILSNLRSCFSYEQVHLSFGENDREIIVTYSNFDEDASKNPSVWYKENGTENAYEQVKGTSGKFVDGGEKKHTQYISRVKLKNLKLNTTYLYYVENVNATSLEPYSFRTPRERVSLLIFGDMGKENPQSLERMIEDTRKGLYDAALHVGDFAYDMDTDNGKVGDEYMRQIEPFAAYLPYMTCPGNHEEKYNFSNYRNRFSMPNGPDRPYYSFNIGNLHIISLSTEFYYFVNYGIKQLVNQYYWLLDDLKRANAPENRAKNRWIVVFGHRPMYCSNDNPADCKRHSTLTRVGLPFFHIFGLERLLNEQGVDLAFWAHEHSYERLYPIYDYRVYKGSEERPYENPRALVHVTTGSAGCKEGKSPFPDKSWPDFSAFRSDDYGYTKLNAFNDTHLYIEQISDDKNGSVIDSFWLIKDGKNQPYPLFYDVKN